MNNKIVLFDMDGTILDSMSVWQSEGYKILKELNIDGAKEISDKFASMSALDIASYVASQGGSSVSKEGMNILKTWRGRVLARYNSDIVAKKGIEDVLNKFKSLGYRLVIATGTPLEIAKQGLKRNGLLDYFDALYDEESIGMGKKNPKFFEILLKKENYAYEDCVVVEDSFFVLEAAKSLGIKTIGIYDVVSKDIQDKVKKYSDIYVVDFKDLIEKID